MDFLVLFALGIISGGVLIFLLQKLFKL